MKNFQLPDLGEGLPGAEIVKWYVKVGDNIKKDQTLASLETAKALIDIPSPFTGRIIRLFGQVGETIKTGDPLVEFEILDELEEIIDQGTVVGKLEVSETIIKETTASLPEVGVNQKGVKTTPFVRALAKRLKVDLTKIQPTGPENTITTKDVELAADVFKEESYFEQLKGPRRAMAETMNALYHEVVPVTVVEDVKLLHFSKEYDITVQLIQAISSAIKSEPALNAWYDGKTFGRRMITELNVGIAMDTPQGLFVPVIYQAEKLNTIQLRQRLEELKKEVKDRTIKLENLKGATILLSNFGKFSGRYATPVVVPPTVAILGAGKLREEVVVVEKKMQIAFVLPLSLTIDHRAVTGGEATRFLQTVVHFLQNACEPHN